MTSNKGANWAPEDVRCLLLLWAEPEIQHELVSKVRNKPIYSKLAAELARAGYAKRDGHSCRDKINRIRREYRAIHDDSRKSGQGNEDDLPFWYDIVHPVLRDKPSTSPVSTLDTGTFKVEVDDDLEHVDDVELHDDVELEAHVDEHVFHDVSDALGPPSRPSSRSSMSAGASSSASTSTYCASTSGSDRARDRGQGQGGSGPDQGQNDTADEPTSSDDELLDTTGHNPVARSDVDDPTVEEEKPQVPHLTGKGKKGKNPVKKRSSTDTKTAQLLQVLNTSNREVREDMERQREADRAAFEQDKYDREREWQRRQETEERWRREDREHTERVQREEREFKMAMMGMLRQQTALMARLTEAQPQPTHPHTSYPPQHQQQFPQQNQEDSSYKEYFHL